MSNWNRCQHLAVYYEIFVINECTTCSVAATGSRRLLRRSHRNGLSVEPSTEQPDRVRSREATVTVRVIASWTWVPGSPEQLS